MRALYLAVALVAAAPGAHAGVMDQPRWSAGTVERRGPLVLTTTLMFETTSPGECRVRARCQTNDSRTGRWSARTGAGRLVLNTASLELFGNVRACGEGQADLGTGD